MIASCNPNSLLSEFSPSYSMLWDLASILCIGSIWVIVLIHHDDRSWIPLFISDDIEEDCDVFFGWICESIVRLPVKVGNHHSLIEWWKSSLWTVAEIHYIRPWEPLIRREWSSVRDHLCKCGTLPHICGPKSGLRELRIERISRIAHGSRVRSMHYHVEILIIYARSSYHEYLPVRDNSLLPVYIRNPREKWENIRVWGLDLCGHDYFCEKIRYIARKKIDKYTIFVAIDSHMLMICFVQRCHPRYIHTKNGITYRRSISPAW